MGSGDTRTLPSLAMSKQDRPPNAAMYWSCLPTGSERMSISMWHASSARAPAVTCSRL